MKTNFVHVLFMKLISYNLVLVPPTAKERVVQITGPSEENIS